MSRTTAVERHVLPRRGTWSALIALVCMASANAPSVLAVNYYVDQSHPSAADTNTGTEASPWRTMYAIDNRTFAPGDQILVKDGVYIMSRDAGWDRPSVNIGSSGTQSAPIRIASVNRHGAILDGQRVQSAPIGSAGRNWVTISGFVVRNTGPKGILVMGNSGSQRVQGVVIENCRIFDVQGDRNLPGDNTDGIRVENASNVILRNNEISNINNWVTNGNNAAGVKTYWVSDMIVENNFIHDAVTGVFDKRGGERNTYRFNRMEDLFEGIYSENGGSSPMPRGNRVHNNLMVNVDIGVDVREYLYDTDIYSNTIYGYTIDGILISPDATARVRVYNNVLVRSSSLPAATNGDLVTSDATPNELIVSNYNVFPSSPTSQLVIDRYGGSRRTLTLAGWRTATGLDLGSVAQNATFVNVGAGDFHLALGSSLLNLGRIGGLLTGLPVSPGAYSLGTEIVGLLSGNTSRPNPPSSVQAQ